MSIQLKNLREFRYYLNNCNAYRVCEFSEKALEEVHTYWESYYIKGAVAASIGSGAIYFNNETLIDERSDTYVELPHYVDTADLSTLSLCVFYHIARVWREEFEKENIIFMSSSYSNYIHLAARTKWLRELDINLQAWEAVGGDVEDLKEENFLAWFDDFHEDGNTSTWDGVYDFIGEAESTFFDWSWKRELVWDFKDEIAGIWGIDPNTLEKLERQHQKLTSWFYDISANADESLWEICGEDNIYIDFNEILNKEEIPEEMMSEIVQLQLTGELLCNP